MHIVRLTGFFWLSLDPLYFPTGKEWKLGRCLSKRRQQHTNKNPTPVKTPPSYSPLGPNHQTVTYNPSQIEARDKMCQNHMVWQKKTDRQISTSGVTQERHAQTKHWFVIWMGVQTPRPDWFGTLARAFLDPGGGGRHPPIRPPLRILGGGQFWGPKVLVPKIEDPPGGAFSTQPHPLGESQPTPFRETNLKNKNLWRRRRWHRQ